jgi:hypothetical protein
MKIAKDHDKHMCEVGQPVCVHIRSRVPLLTKEPKS